MESQNDSTRVEYRGTAESVGRWLAVVEVTALFAGVHVCYRAIKHFTVIGRWDSAAGMNLTPGLVMIAFTVAIVWLSRGDFRAYGLTLDQWRNCLSTGVMCTAVDAGCAALGLLLSGYQLDAAHPPDPHGHPPWAKLGVVAAFLLAGWIMALAIVSSRRRVRELPATLSIALIGLLAAVPSLLAAFREKSFPWSTTLWLMLGAGFGEEIFFRGYIQSRVDRSWGRPYCLLGFEFGAGLLVSSLLFGLVHALNTVDYFSGRFDFGWLMGVSSVFVGAYFGLIRSKTGSILPGAILHGLTDVLARIPNVLRS